MPYDYARERDEARAADLGDESKWDYADELAEQESDCDENEADADTGD